MSDDTQNETAQTAHGVQFTLTNGQVSAMAWVEGSATHTLPIPGNATFTVNGTTVTETLAGTRGTQTLQFTQDATNTALYHITGESLTVANPSTTDSNGHVHGYSFTLSNGAVTAVQRVDGASASTTHSHDLAILPGESFAISSTGVTETIVSGNTIETLQFVAVGTGGLYALAAETTTVIQSGTATTRLDVHALDRDLFTLGSNGAVTQVQAVKLDGTSKTLTVPSNVTYTQLKAGYVLETVVKGSTSHYEVYHDGNGDGIYTNVAHGSGSVDLVGLKAQINATIDALT